MLFFILFFSIRKPLSLHAKHDRSLPYSLIQSLVVIDDVPCTCPQSHLKPLYNSVSPNNKAELHFANQIQTQIA